MGSLLSKKSTSPYAFQPQSNCILTDEDAAPVIHRPLAISISRVPGTPRLSHIDQPRQRDAFVFWVIFFGGIEASSNFGELVRSEIPIRQTSRKRELQVLVLYQALYAFVPIGACEVGRSCTVAEASTNMPTINPTRNRTNALPEMESEREKLI
ncbi:MAG TPA: hypothetical protein VMO00_10180 [Methylomirabilota bacterium]|nr:hypothetical protein [Methylomirabilota bacterium]